MDPALYRRRKLINQIGIGASMLAMALGLVALLWILAVLFGKGIGGLDLNVFTQSTPAPGSEGGGLANAIVGSLMMIVFTTLVATPLGILAGVYLAEYGQSGWFGETTRFVTDVMLSAPSIVIGLFVYAIAVDTVDHFSGWAGSLALSLIAVPVILRTTENMLRLVPGSLREAAFALGAPRWRVATMVTLRAARSGVVTGVLLALARISGETAPLLFTALNNQFFSTDMSKPMANLPVVIFQFAMSPYDNWIGLDRCAADHRSGSGAQYRGPGLLQRQGAVVTTSLSQPATEQSQAGVVNAIETRSLNFFYGKFQGLRNINLDVVEHKVTAFIGPSGCGKSTLLRTLNRMYSLYPGQRAEGSIMFEGRNILDPGQDLNLLRARIGMVFQKPTPFPMSIYDNIAFGVNLYERLNRAEMDARVEWALSKAALWGEVKDKLRQSGLSLSGGQQQRLCIARSVAVKPSVILLDEPTSALDPISTAKVEQLVHELKSEYTVAIVTHNMQQAARVSDFTVYMYLGEMIEYGRTDEIFLKPKSKQTEDYITGRFG